jgi:hypothetical protein
MRATTKRWILASAALMLAAGSWVGVSAGPDSDSVRVAALVDEMNRIDFASLDSLPPIAVRAYQLPTPSVDVMRVRLEESYTVEGVGEDTVELAGWIAVRHGAPRPAAGYSEVSWATAVTDTEFVGMDLRGESRLFGPVHVTLDSTRPAIGQVGQIDLPEAAVRTLLASNSADTKTDTSTAQPVPGSGLSGSNCRAPVNVKVSMSELGLEMKTEHPAVWFSRVTTIPPVGHEASVTVEPVPLVSADRRVGTLVSGTVKFREVVRAVALSKGHQVIASLGGAVGR